MLEVNYRKLGGVLIFVGLFLLVEFGDMIINALNNRSFVGLSCIGTDVLFGTVLLIAGIRMFRNRSL